MSTQDATGARVCEARIDDNEPAAFAAYFARLPEPSRVVVEACWNWGWLYDELGEIDRVEDVVLAHPFKTRLIADAQIKTDKLDARALATLLRGNLLATVHAPDPANRSRKHVIRQRLFLARVRTMVRNRVHTLVARQRNLARPVFSDQFGKKGLHWLRTLELPAPDATLLRQDLATLEQLGTVIKELETQIGATNTTDAATARLQSLPGVGPILAAVMAAEIDGIARFPRANKLCCYAGLVPTTHSSGGKTSHGRMMPFANRCLKWAFIEAAWVAPSAAPAILAISTPGAGGAAKRPTPPSPSSPGGCAASPGSSCTTGVTFSPIPPTHFVPGCSVQRLTSVHPLRLGSVWRAGDLIDYYVRQGLTACH